MHQEDWAMQYTSEPKELTRVGGCNEAKVCVATGFGLARGILLVLLLTFLTSGCGLFRSAPRPQGYARNDQSAASGARVVQTAKKYLGAPYRSGGESPRQGFDCSGLTQTVFYEQNISLPRKSEEQANMGTPVSRNNLQPGDLLFFDTSGRGNISHVGIYIGKDKMIHASQREGVCVDSISKDYFQRRYVSARRLTNGMVATKARALR
jgi:hypothetical protein